MTLDRGLLVDMVARLPQGRLSRAWGWLARRRRPRWAVGLLKRGFARAVRINLADALHPMDAFENLEALFVRQLRPNARPIDASAGSVVSPVDGTLGACGVVQAGTLLQVKGRTYRLATLLGSAQDAARFEGGHYLTLYLAPPDYHRIHAPLAGQICQSVTIPGRLLPVFAEALAKIDDVFARNERLITYMKVPRAGRVAIVKVGATLVGRITVAYDPSLRTNSSSAASRRVEYAPPIKVVKGGELGTFELGSSVVLLFEAAQIKPLPLAPGCRVQLGQPLAHMCAPLGPRRRRPKKGAPAAAKLRQ